MRPSARRRSGAPRTTSRAGSEATASRAGAAATTSSEGAAATTSSAGAAATTARARARRSTARFGFQLRALCALLLLLLVGVSLATMAARQATMRSREAVEVNEVLQDARLSVATEESTERKYLLESSDAARQEHARAMTQVDSDMALLAPLDARRLAAFADRVRRDNAGYTLASLELFAAVDRHLPAAQVERVDSGRVDPAFGALLAEVRGAAETWQRRAVHEARRADRIGWLALAVDVAAFVVALLGVVLVGRRLALGQRQLAQQSRVNEHQAQHDALTGLPNRALLARRLAAALVDNPRGGVTVAILDLDRFKEVNDSLGHHSGDALLRQIGPRLASVLRRDDVLARLGGDEFALLLTGGVSPDGGVAEHRAVLERVAEALERPFEVEGLSLGVEASIGMATSPQHGHTAEDLLRHADSAMYQAKRQHGGVAVFDPARLAQTPHQLTMLTELRAAIGEDQLVLHFQPVVELATGRPVALEALVRWQHPREGLLPPGRFVPAAEGSGLILPMTRHVVALACRQARLLLERGHLLAVAVNVSPRCLSDTRLPEMVGEACAAADLPPELLTVELTETAMVADPAAARLVVDRLRALGVRVALDDFGTGYTSLAYLRDLPISELKVDRRFVAAMVAEPADRAIVDTTALLARRLGLVAVAEGIEDAVSLEAARDAGCERGQGFQIARPMAMEQLLGWLREHDRPPAGAGEALWAGDGPRLDPAPRPRVAPPEPAAPRSSLLG